MNTWCQSECRSSDLSFLPHSAGHIIYLSVSLSDQLRKCLCLLAFSVFVVYVFLWVFVSRYICGLNPLYTHIKQNVAPKGN